MSDPLPGMYGDTRKLTITGSINHEVAIKLGDEETFFTWARDLLTAARQAATESSSLPSVHPRDHDHINAREAADCDTCNSPAPRPLLDRDAVKRILDEVRALPVTSSSNPHVGAVMEMARPMPTREQIDTLLQEWCVRPPGQPTQVEAVNYRRKMRNALLALLNGTES